MKNILFVSAEVTPYVKTGGLADVVGALPQELLKFDNEVDVILPKYSSISQKNLEGMSFITDFEVKIGWRNSFAGLWKKTVGKVNYYFIENEYYFNRGIIYGNYDDGEKFSYFNKAVLESLKYIDKDYDILHLNDWHTGMISLLLKDQYLNDEKYKKIKTVYTIHNLKYQGIYNPIVLDEILGLDMEYFYNGSVEFYGNINFMKAGITFSDVVTTVSKTYSDEIKDEYYGEGLHGLFSSADNKLIGVVNGIDTSYYNPKTDKDISYNYDLRGYKKKRKNKAVLQDKLGLEINKDVPMIGIVTRLVEAKGIDLILHVLKEVLELDLQVVLLGTGDEKYENDFKWFDANYENFSGNIYFSAETAKNIYASADIFLMPSRYEPCGLGQLIAQRYGNAPIVRKTGGLADTVANYDPITKEGNGFVFEDYNAHSLLFKIKEAIELYKDDDDWQNVFKNCMKSDNSWANSASKYNEIYDELVKE
jgi:starch synthase